MNVVDTKLQTIRPAQGWIQDFQKEGQSVEIGGKLADIAPK